MEKIPYNICDYKKLVMEEYCYVDKTMYLEKLEDVSKYLYYLRPEGFGKTLFTSMMFYYYDVKSKDLFDTLFKDTYAYNNPTKYRNSYYVIRFDFSGITRYDMDGNINLMKGFNACLYRGINEFCEHYGLHYEIDESLVPADCFRDFMMFYQRLRGKEIDEDGQMYVIIDNYDDIINIVGNDEEAFKKSLGNYGFIKPFYAVLKSETESLIDRIFITGVCSIYLDSFTSGFNIGTIISDRYSFNAMTAFTEDEVKELIKDLPKNAFTSMSTYEDMKWYYGRYAFYKPMRGDKDYLPLEKVFNPMLVMHCLNCYAIDGDLSRILKDSDIMYSYEQLLNVAKIRDNAYYEKVLDEIINGWGITGKIKCYIDLSGEIKRDDVISMLYYFGYLTISGYNEVGWIIFKISNRCVENLFLRHFSNWLKKYNIYLD